jgi:hypothetical protein
MTRFVKRLLIFVIPMAAYCAFIAVVDPFDFFGISSAISPGIKLRTAKAMNECFWKMEHYDRHPASGILLGDSRMDAIPGDKISGAAHREYFNLAFGGGTLNEMIELFWFAARRTRLTDAYFGLNLDTYNDYNYTDRTLTYKTVRGNPGLYFVDRRILRAAVYDAYSQLSHDDLKIAVPPMSRDQFWRHQLDSTARGYYTNFVYPLKCRRQLERVAAYCAANHISLNFVILPTHVDLQNRIRDFHLDQESQQFRRDLAAMAPVYDFDYPNDITLQKDNFSDPYHFRGPIADVVIAELWQGKLHYGRRPNS